MINIAVFASGRGSNLDVILARADRGCLGDTRVSLVISNNSRSRALKTAADRGIAALHLSTRTHPVEADLTDAIRRTLKREDIGLIVLAGYMKRLPAAVVQDYRGRILNIHPALLPRHGGQGMYGINVHRAVIDSGDSETGVTVHLVDEVYDHGPIVHQEKVPVRSDDSAETLAQRVLKVEHDVYWRAIAKISRELQDSSG